LGGIFYELEDSRAIFTKDTIARYSIPDTVNQLFKPFSRFNLTLRPTLEFRPNDVLRVAMNSYIKGNWLENQTYTNAQGIESGQYHLPTRIKDCIVFEI